MTGLIILICPMIGPKCYTRTITSSPLKEFCRKYAVILAPIYRWKGSLDQGSRNVASWRRRVSSEGWKSRRDVRKFSEGAREQSVDYGEEETMPWVSAYLIKSAVVLRLRWSMICPLWNSTVREETFKRLAISLAVRPSTRSCRISR
jgi:hypothetical protein